MYLGPVNKKISVKNLIALCHILDDYEKFDEEAKEYFLIEQNKDAFSTMYRMTYLNDVLRGKKCVTPAQRKAKKFYENNKKVIDIINKYSDVYSFCIDFHNNIHVHRKNVEFFYKYLREHRDNLDDIIALTKKIKDLGITELYFDEEGDFQKETCQLHTDYISEISYLENMEAILNYDNNIIEYKTNGSNYKISFYLVREERNDGIRDLVIEVDNLLFSPDSLPTKIDPKNMINEIIELKSGKEKEFQAMEDSVDLNLSRDDLSSLIYKLEHVTNGLEAVSENELGSIKEIISNLRENLNRLNKIIESFDERIIKENPDSITKETLLRELRKRKEK